MSRIPFLHLTYALAGAALLSAPLAEAGWDVWSKSLIHIISVLAFLVLLAHFYFQKKEFAVPGTFLLPAFLILFALSAAKSKIPFQSGIEFNLYVNYVVFILLAVNLPEDGAGGFVEKMSPYIALSVLIMSVFSFYQRIFAGLNPVHSTMINANVFAGYLVLSMPLFAGKARNPFYGAALACGAVALILTKSSGAMFALICAFLITRLGFRRGVLFSLLGAAALLIAKAWTMSVGERLIWWGSALRIIAHYPFFGSGPGTFEFVYPAFKTAGQSSLYAHNYYLQMCSDIGIPAAILLFVFIMRRVFNKTPTPIKVALLASLIQNIGDFNLLVPANGLLFWTLLGVLCSGQLGKIRVRPSAFTAACIVVVSAYYVSSVGRIYSAVVKYNDATYMLKERKYDDSEKYLKEALALRNDFWLARSDLAALKIIESRATGRMSPLIEASFELQRAVLSNPFYPANRGMMEELKKRIPAG